MIDKYITNWKWSIVLFILIILYFLGEENTKIKLITFFVIVFFGGLLAWTLFITSSKKVRGKVHWKSGEITYTGYFDNYCKYEEWKDQLLTHSSYLIYTIDEEEQQISEG